MTDCECTLARKYDSITPEQAALIEGSPVFFVATADPAGEPGPLGEGPVNLSPKGDSRLTLLDDHTVAYIDFTGSGNQTARHIDKGSAVTLMVCSFDEKDAAIVRLFGSGSVHELNEYPRKDMLERDKAGEIALPERQVIEVNVTHTITSCGYGVPVSDGFRPRTVGDRGRAFK